MKKLRTTYLIPPHSPTGPRLRALDIFKDLLCSPLFARDLFSGEQCMSDYTPMRNSIAVRRTVCPSARTTKDRADAWRDFEGTEAIV